MRLSLRLPALALLLALAACSSGAGGDYMPPTDDGGGAIDLARADLVAPPAVAPTTAVSVVVMPGPGMTPVINAIKSARTSVDLGVYFLSDNSVVNALIAARNAGRKVRVLLEPKPDQLSNTQVYNQLAGAGVQVRWGGPSFYFTHEKLLIVDGQTAWIMTMNLASSAASTNREYLLVDTDPDDLAEARALFDADFAGVAPTMTPRRLVVSPGNARARLGALIDSARSTLDVEWETLTDADLATRINNRIKAGVRVRIVVPDTSAGTTTGSIVSALQNGGGEARLLGNPDIHAKMILVDRTIGFIGSQNATATSIDRNREVGVIWQNAQVMQAVGKAFDADFAAGKRP